MLFGKWSGTEIKLDGEDVLIMKESDIMGVLAKASLRNQPRHRSVMPGHDPGIHVFENDGSPS